MRQQLSADKTELDLKRYGNASLEHEVERQERGRHVWGPGLLIMVGRGSLSCSCLDTEYWRRGVGCSLGVSDGYKLVNGRAGH